MNNVAASMVMDRQTHTYKQTTIIMFANGYCSVGFVWWDIGAYPYYVRMIYLHWLCTCTIPTCVAIHIPSVFYIAHLCSTTLWRNVQIYVIVSGCWSALKLLHFINHCVHVLIYTFIQSASWGL